MRREQREQAVVGEFSLQRFEANFLQNDIAVGIAEHLLMDAVASRIASIHQLKYRNPGLDGNILELTIALFFREKILAVGYDESHVARASLIHARKVDFI